MSTEYIVYKVRKKPNEVEAIQVDSSDYDKCMAIVEWCGGRAVGPEQTGDENAMIAIDTLEGTMLANDKDWIIKGIKGEFYPCKPDIFEASYEFCETI